MFKSILVLCTGNICRSPMAEALLKARLAERGVDVSSAGTAALVGAPADPLAVEIMSERGFDLSTHRGRQATQPLLNASDLILTMDKSHHDWVSTRYPQLRGRTQPLGRWRRLEIDDPYRRPRGAFESACEDIEACVADWVPRLK